MHRYFLLFLISCCGAGLCCAGPPVVLLPGSELILEHIYSGQGDLAIGEAQELQKAWPAHPLGYILEAEALWWKIWISSAEYKYGMSMARHRERLAADQYYLDLSAKALTLAQASLKNR